MAKQPAARAAKPALPRLNPLIEGVDFELVIAGRPCRAFVMSDVLCGRYGAGPDPAQWLAAYERHEAALHALARAVHAGVEREPVVLWEPLLQRLGL
jgi:hypothetical protein